mmetsp:Transcript_41599/g.75248  ORF Transcript_41599/g.75248 Transcript_41599/m.75248 type:complete len:151 (+) Transcript_41599:124-576(+)
MGNFCPAGTELSAEARQSELLVEDIKVGQSASCVRTGVSGKVLARTTTDILLRTSDGKEQWSEVEDVIKETTCKNCGNTGVDFLGKVCTCPFGIIAGEVKSIPELEAGMAATDTRQGKSGQVLRRTTTDIQIRLVDGTEVWCDAEDVKAA